jgi:hypothetical protein
MLARPAHRALHVGSRLAENDGVRLDRIEARVEQKPRLLVRRGTRKNDLAAQTVGELAVDSGFAGSRELDQRSPKGQAAGDKGNATTPNE